MIEIFCPECGDWTPVDNEDGNNCEMFCEGHGTHPAFVCWHCEAKFDLTYFDDMDMREMEAVSLKITVPPFMEKAAKKRLFLELDNCLLQEIVVNEELQEEDCWRIHIERCDGEDLHPLFSYPVILKEITKEAQEIEEEDE